jgi:hypothetical protein
MADEEVKIYSPEEVTDTEISTTEETTSSSVSDSSSSGSNISSPSTVEDSSLPVKVTAHETIASSLNTKSQKILGEYTFAGQGAIRIGEYTNGVSGDIRITPNGITARNSAGITTFILDGDSGDATFRGTILAGSVIAAEIQGDLIVANSIDVSKLDVTQLSSISSNLGTVTAGAMSGVSISIGSGDSVFKADSNGISLGNDTFASAPFRVTMAGALYASSATISGTITSGSGSSYTGNQINNAYIGNLSATKITSDTMSANRISGGTLTMGGSGNGNGVIDVKNSSNSTIIYLDSVGITLVGESCLTARSAVSGTIYGFLDYYDSVFSVIAGNGAVGFFGNVNTGTNTFFSGAGDTYLTSGSGYTVYIGDSSSGSISLRRNTTVNADLKVTGDVDLDGGTINNSNVINNTTFYGNNIWYWNLNHYCEIFSGDPFQILESFFPEAEEEGKNSDWKKVDHSRLNKEIYASEQDERGETVREGYDITKLLQIQRVAILQLKQRVIELENKRNQ